MNTSLVLSHKSEKNVSDFEKKSFMTVKELAKQLNVAEQTIKNTIYELRQVVGGVFTDIQRNNQGGYLLNYEQATAIKLKLRSRNNLKDNSVVVGQIVNDLEFFALLKKREQEQQILDEYRDRRIAELTAENQALQETNNSLMHVSKTYTASEIAKEVGFTGATTFNKVLEKLGIQYKRNNTWLPTSKYADKGYYEIKQDVLENRIVIYNSHFTQKGREFVLKLHADGKLKIGE